MVDPDNSEIFWSCYAWPVDASRSGNRVFFINQEGELLQFSNRAGVYSNTIAGGGAQPSFDAAHSIANDMASVLAINGVASVDTNLWTVVQ